MPPFDILPRVREPVRDYSTTARRGRPNSFVAASRCADYAAHGGGRSSAWVMRTRRRGPRRAHTRRSDRYGIRLNYERHAASEPGRCRRKRTRRRHPTTRGGVSRHCCRGCGGIACRLGYGAEWAPGFVRSRAAVSLAGFVPGGRSAWRCGDPDRVPSRKRPAMTQHLQVAASRARAATGWPGDRSSWPAPPTRTDLGWHVVRKR